MIHIPAFLEAFVRNVSNIPTDGTDIFIRIAASTDPNTNRKSDLRLDTVMRVLTNTNDLNLAFEIQVSTS